MNGKYAGKKMYTAMSAFFLIYLSFVLPFKMFITGYLLQTKYFFWRLSVIKKVRFRRRSQTTLSTLNPNIKRPALPSRYRFQKSGHPTCAPMRKVQYTQTNDGYMLGNCATKCRHLGPCPSFLSLAGRTNRNTMPGMRSASQDKDRGGLASLANINVISMPRHD